MDYTSAVETLNSKTRGDKDRKKLDHNTYLERHDGFIAVRLHNTDILKFYPDHTVVDTDGWLTVTTKDRLNKFMPCGYRAYSKNRVWYLNRWTVESGYQTLEIGFKDGMEISSDGTVSGCATGDTFGLKKQIDAYVKSFMQELVKGNIEAPSNGDCFGCVLDSPIAFGHFQLHLEENYYVPSLLSNAIGAFQVSLHALSVVANLWTEDGEWKDSSGIAERQIKSSLKRYMYRNLGLAS